MSASMLFDKLRQDFDIPSDAALARELNVSASDISKYRAGRPVGARMILSIHEWLGIPVKDIRELLA